MDTSSLIGFLVEIDGADLLRQLTSLGHELLVCPSVDAELRRPATRAKARAVKELVSCAAADPDALGRLKARYPGLGSGEVEVIALGIRYKASQIEYLCVLDDKSAREAAQELELMLIGAVGLIEILLKAGRIDAPTAERLVLALVTGGFRYRGH